jgi:phage-related protein
MFLSAFLKLDGGAFTTGMGKALEGTKLLTRTLGDLGAKLKTGFDFGSDMAHLSTQLGISAGRATVLRQVFDDTGVGADSMAQTLTIMGKALGGVNEEGEPTNKMFRRLGLSVDDLKKMDAEGQFFAIGNAIKGIEDPAERVSALTSVFGKGGAPLARLFADDGALEAAEARLGGLPKIMDKNANAFENISTRVSALKMKTTGFWAGMAAGVLPMADSITRALDGIDLSGLGQRVGEWMSAIVEMFGSVPIGELLWTGAKAAGEQVFNFIGKGLEWIAEQGNKLGDWIGRSLANAWFACVDAFNAAWDWIARALSSVGSWIADSAEQGWAWAAESFDDAWNLVTESLSSAGDWISDSVTQGWEWATQAFNDFWDWVLGGFKGSGGALVDGLKSGIEWLYDSLKFTGSILWDSIKVALGRVANAVAGIFGKKLFDLEDLEAGLSEKWGSSLAAKAIDATGEALASLGGALGSGFDAAIEGVGSFANGVADVVGNAFDAIGRAGESAMDGGGKFLSGVGDFFEGVVDAMGAVGKEGFFNVGDRNSFALSDMFSNALQNVRDNPLADNANASFKNPWGGGGLNLAGKKGGTGGSNDILSDALARIGGMTGGISGNARKMEGLAERTARNTEEMVRIAKSNMGLGGAAQAVFA